MVALAARRTGPEAEGYEAGLVYICALGPDETETSQGQQDKYPKTPVFSRSTSPTGACG